MSPSMSPRVILACNPYPHGSTLTTESWECWAPDNMIIVRCYTEGDEVGQPDGVLLEEDGLDIGMPRPLPFVRDLLNCAGYSAFLGNPEAKWVGVANMDLDFTEPFFQVFDQAETLDCLTIAVHRRDRDLSTGTISPVTHWKSMDAFFIRWHVWEDLRESFPRFLLGAPAWDMGAKAWTLLHTLPCYELADDSVLHNTHTGLWRQRMFLETEGAYNRKLFRTLMDQLRKSGVPPGLLHINPRHWSAHE